MKRRVMKKWASRQAKRARLLRKQIAGLHDWAMIASLLTNASDADYWDYTVVEYII